MQMNFKYFRNILFVIVFLLTGFSISDTMGQNKQQTDSLKQLAFVQEYEAYKNSDKISAYRTAQTALQYFESQNNYQHLCFWYEETGNSYKIQNNFDDALICYSKGYNLSKQHNENSGHWFLLIANLYFAADNFIEAQKFFTKSLSECKKDEAIYYNDISDAYTSLGIIHERENRMQKALELYRLSHNLLKSKSLSSKHIRSFLTIGIFYLNNNKIDSAEYYLKKGIINTKKLEEKPYYTALYLYKAQAKSEKNNFLLSDSCIDTALLFAETNEPVKMASIYLKEAELLFERSEYENAKISAVKGLFHAESQKLEYENIKLLTLISKTHKALNNYKLAFEYLEKVNKKLKQTHNLDFLNTDEFLKQSISKTNIIAENIIKKPKKNDLWVQIHPIMLSAILVILLLSSSILLYNQYKVRKTNKLLSGSLNSVTDQSIEIRESHNELKDSHRKISGQAALASILEDSSGVDFFSNSFLQLALKRILKTPWFITHKQGFIVLFTKDKLIQIASQNIDNDITHNKKFIKNRNSSHGNPLIVSEITATKEACIIDNLGLTGNSEFLLVPLTNNQSYLGVIGLTLNKESSKEKDVYINFLNSVSFSLSSIISRERHIKERNEQQKEQEQLNEQLFAQNLILEEKNKKIRNITTGLKKQKTKIEKAHKNITDSIAYAKYIQTALLPTDAHLKEAFEDSFVFFRPKDVVSGDFYFIKKVKNFTVFAVGDCTGHGVAGALLTALSISILNDITKRPETYTPDYMLELLRAKIKNTFKQFGTENSSGLDIALCSLDTQTNILHYAGAFSPLIIVRDGKMIEYKPTRNPIGFYPVEKRFENHEIEIKKNDIMYLFSDGYPDQIGGEKRRKFTKRAFKQNLVEISNLTMDEQATVLEESFDNRKGENIQVDDVTVMGIKLSEV